MNVIYSRQLVVGGAEHNRPELIPKPDGLPVSNSIFLLGPTPRKHTPLPSWRVPDALAMLADLGFTGTVFVPEDSPTSNSPWSKLGDLPEEAKAAQGRAQVRWEWWRIGQATCLCAWIPRDMKRHMEGLTTNVEVGFAAALEPGRVVLGAPPDADKVSYLQQLADDYAYFKSAMGVMNGIPEIPFHATLRDTLKAAIAMAGE